MKYKYVYIGDCGNCGGNVLMPASWNSVQPPRATCDHCGSTARAARGGAISMNPIPRSGRGHSRMMRRNSDDSLAKWFTQRKELK